MISMKKSKWDLTQVERKQVVSADFLAPLIRDVILVAFEFLSNKDLRNIALVNKKAYTLSKIARLKRFQNDLESSQLWRCLCSLYLGLPGNELNSFVSYLQNSLAPTFYLDDTFLINTTNINQYFIHWDRGFNGIFKSLGFSIENPNKVHNKIGELLRLLVENNDAGDPQSCSTLNQLINLSADSNRLLAWKRYYDLDRIFSTMMLFTALNNMPENQRLHFLIFSPLNRTLSGNALLKLDSTFSGLFTEMLSDLVRLVDIKGKTCEENIELMAIEKIIQNLSEVDFIKYLNIVQHRYTPRECYEINLKILKMSIDGRCKALSDKIDGKFIVKTVNNYYAGEYFESYILEIILMLLLDVSYIRNINNRDKALLLSNIKIKDLIGILRKKVELHSTFNFSLLKDIVENVAQKNSDKSALVCVCLIENTIVSNFNQEQVINLMRYLNSSDFEIVLSDRKCMVSSTLNKYDFAKRIITDNKFINHVRVLFKNPYYGKVIASNNYAFIDIMIDELINRLSRNDIVEIALAHPCIGLYALKDRVKSMSTHELVVVENYFARRIHSMFQRDLYNLCKKERADRSSIMATDRYVYSYNGKLQKKSTYVNWGLFLNLLYLLVLTAIFLLLVYSFFAVAYFAFNKLNLTRIESKSFGSLLGFILFLAYIDYEVIKNVWSKTNFRITKTMYEDPPMLDQSREPKYCFVPREQIQDNHDIDNNRLINNTQSPKDTKFVSEQKQIGQGTNPEKDTLMWGLSVIQIICVFGTILGVLLAGAGLGSALGISIMVSAVDFLFSYSTLGSAFTAALVGAVIYITSVTTWIISNSIQQVPEKAVPKIQTNYVCYEDYKPQQERLSLNRFCLNYQNSVGNSFKAKQYPKSPEIMPVDTCNENIDDVLVFKF